MTAKFETEIIRAVWNNGSGGKVTAKPDSDGLDLVEIIDDEGHRIILYPEQARLVADALRACADDIKPADTA